MKQLTVLVLFYFMVSLCSAQAAKDSSRIFVLQPGEESGLLSKAMIFIDSSSTLPVAAVLTRPFEPLEHFENYLKLTPRSIGYTFYLKLLLKNNSAADVTGYIYPGSHFTYFELYKIDDTLLKITDNDMLRGFRRIKLSAGELSTILVQLRPLKNDINFINPVFINSDYINKYNIYVAGYKTDLHIYGLVLSGVLLMMILFMITNFFISKKREFLLNALYSCCMFLLIFLNSTMFRSSSAFTNLYYSYFDFFLLVIGTVFYISFTRKFLDTKNNYQQLDTVLKYGEQFVLVLLMIYTLMNFLTPTYLPQYYLENFMKVFILLIGLVFIYLALKQKNRLLNYIAAGNAVLVLFSVISLCLILFKVKPTEIYFSALFYYNTGIVFELTFFLLGLTYKNRSELIKGIKEQEALKLEAEKTGFETQIAVMKAQQDERNRISADMHDDLGAGMTTISLYSELAKSKLVNNPIPEIDKISSSANELLSKMNAIIWSMSSSNDSLGNMIAYIRSYALEYFENTGIRCRISIPENLPNIQVIGGIRRNVFLVVKEALNNVLKHSKATEVSITLTRDGDSLNLYIQDNGTGINLDKIRQFGNGLKNMKKRMNDIDIEFSIENSNGTLITLRRKVLGF